jgi:outer membrane protein assembly factor BamD (BamD/ComL family)
MQRAFLGLRNVLLMGCMLGLAACGTFGPSKPYQETNGKRGWHPFLHPAEKKPDAQLVFADQLRQAGRTKAAMKQYVALTVYWPESPEAAAAQYQYAKLWDRKGKDLRAFDEYQRLFNRYPGQFSYDEVLNRQFEIATNLMYRKKGKLLFFPGFSAPERAIPLFQAIITNAPQWKRTAETQYLMGRANELSLEYEAAIDNYMTVQNRYPDSAFAELSSFRTAYCYYLLAQESPNNEQILDAAWAAMTVFLNNYPSAEMAPVATEYRNTMYRWRAKIAYEKANYYDTIAKRPESALIAYESMVRQFPHSDWTGLAQIRIDALSNSVVRTQKD